VTGLRDEFRQRRYRKEFRIGPAATDLDALLTDLRDPPSAATVGELDDDELADAVTNLWRARRRLVREGEETSATRQAGRYLRHCQDSLAEAGLVVQDHDGDVFHPGRSVEVLVFQDDPALTVETVLETVRPSIYLNDRRIQMGQVIVGCPAGDRSGTRSDHA
jgi:hypothetical protein